MNILLWVLQALLAAAFLAHGLLFLSPPAADRCTDQRGAAAVVPAPLLLFAMATFVGYMR